MKKKLISLLAGLSVLVILTSAPFATAAFPFVEVEVGDSFNYVISDVYFFLEENSVLVAEETGVGIVNNTINVVVDAIFESSEIMYLGLPYGAVTFNVSETIGGQTFLGQTPLDMWYSLFVSLDFLYYMLVDGFSPYDPPDLIIEIPDTSTYDFMKGLPIFANSNTSFYEHLESQVNAEIYPNIVYDDSTNPVINPSIPARSVEVSYTNGIFKLNVTNHGYFGEGETTTDVAYVWSVLGTSNYYVEVDTKNGLVLKMSYSLDVETIVEGYKTDLIMKVGIEKSDTGRTWTLGISFIEPLLAILGLTTFWVIIRRIKK
jgi:hypothetical protein